MKKLFFLLILVSITILSCQKQSDNNNNQQELNPTGYLIESLEELQSVPLITSDDSTLFPIISYTKTLPGSVVLDVPEPGNQGGMNSCVAWAIGYGMMSYHFKHIEGNSEYLPDGLFSPNFIWNLLNGGKNEAITIIDGLSKVYELGCCKLSDMPITTPKDVLPSAVALDHAKNYKLTKFQRLENDINEIKAFISRGYPIVAGLEVDSKFCTNDVSQFEKQSNGRLVWKAYADDGEKFEHCMLLCGYDDEIHALKVLNSWGSLWGDKGYIWIDYDLFTTAVVSPFGIASIWLGVIKRPYLRTNSVTEITHTSAKCGGNIYAAWGLAVTERGVCWNTNSNPTIVDNKTTNGTGSGNFTSSLTGLTANTKYYIKAYAINSEGISYGKEVSFTTAITPSYSIGQNYGGGIIFYIDGTGEHGLITAASDQSTSIKWYNGSLVITGADGTAIGTGISNTQKIVSALGNGNYAAKICDELLLGGFDDWFLPSMDELDALFDFEGDGGLDPNNIYWGSNESGGSGFGSGAWNQSKYFDGFDGAYANHRVRAIRAF